MHEHQLAQLNVARMVAPIDDSRMADFVAWLDVINRLAERSTGFVWRLHDDSGNATGLPVTDDPMVIANLTVWRSVEDLRVFTEHLLRDMAKEEDGLLVADLDAVATDAEGG